MELCAVRDARRFDRASGGQSHVRAAIFTPGHKAPGEFLQIEDVPRPRLKPGYVLLRVVACGVCRTDMHIVEGDLPPIQSRLIPGHQIVGEVVEGETTELPLGSRVGVSWMGSVDGDCWYCRHGM
jgi:propanol-preferring alcohol dehydrogenase